METEEERKARFLREESERYEYLLQCAEAAYSEELAWETIEARLHTEDFVDAAKEALAGRKARNELVAFHDSYDSDRDQYAVTGKLFRILYAWDRAVGRKSPVDPHSST